MYVIGERINGMFKVVREALKNKDKKAIQDLAIKQMQAGSSALDVNTGAECEDQIAGMKWLIEAIQEVLPDVTLAIDSPKPVVLEAGLAICKNRAIINSTTGEAKKLETLMPLAKKYNAMIIGVTISEKGVPSDSNGRIEIAANIVASAMEHGVEPNDVFIDPVILPVNVAQQQCPEVLRAIAECKMISSPSPKTNLGLSNVSQGTKKRVLINRTYLVMALSHGLDAAILDPLDNEIMDAVITAELLLNKNIYCDSYLEAYRKK